MQLAGAGRGAIADGGERSQVESDGWCRGGERWLVESRPQGRRAAAPPGRTGPLAAAVSRGRSMSDRKVLASVKGSDYDPRWWSARGQNSRY
jgi:hypothetical protein